MIVKIAVHACESDTRGARENELKADAPSVSGIIEDSDDIGAGCGLGRTEVQIQSRHTHGGQKKQYRSGRCAAYEAGKTFCSHIRAPTA